jgi:hypothetical protein
MELPNDIWATIIQKTRSLKNCKKLYDSLPMRVKNDLESIYLVHKASLNLRFICAFHGNFSIYNSDILEKRTYLSDILLVKYVKNWSTQKGMMDCIVVGTKWGKILFLDAITMDHIEYIDVGGSKLSDIEFHPTKSIMLLVTDGFYGKKLKILRFDLDRSEFTVAIEFLGPGKKLFFFHPTQPEIYIFNLNNLKLGMVYFCNYQSQSLGFSNLIHSYLYLNNLYTPLKIRDDGTFDCIKYENSANHFCNFKIDHDEVIELQIQPVLEDSGIKDFINVWDFLRRGDDIYFYTNQKGDSRIYKQSGNEYKIIYSSINNLFKFYCKNDSIIFMENNILKVLDLNDNLLIDEFFLENSAVDFMIL